MANAKEHLMLGDRRKRRTAKIVIVTFLLSVVGLGAMAQTKFSATAGQIDFTSKAQLEMIKASSSKIDGVLIPATSQFAFSVPIQSFKGFNTELQRQHFNENYLESEKYPKATFSGKIIEPIDYTVDGAYDVRAKGNLDIHGVKQNRIIRSRLIISKGVITIESQFTVPLAEHNISIPKIVNQKIATEIEVRFSSTLKSTE